MLAVLKWGLAVLLISGSAWAETVGHGHGGGSPIPAAASSAGYLTNTYHIPAGGFTTANVDTTSSYASGFQIYLGRFLNLSQTLPPFSDVATINSDGSLTIGYNDANAPAYQLSSASYVSTDTPPYVGIAFGCGAYITAEISMPQGQNPAGYWTFFYGNPVETLFYPFGSIQQNWPGQPTAYSAYVETDFMENIGIQSSTQQHYFASLHNWYGVYQVTCPSGYCDVNNSANAGNEAIVPLFTDFTGYHRFGFLWIPATNTVNGSISFWFDDEKVNGPFAFPVSYVKFNNQSPPPAAPFTFSILDQQHLVLIWGGSSINKITVKSVDVWQGMGACNLSN